jgi:hypothetical protein
VIRPCPPVSGHSIFQAPPREEAGCSERPHRSATWRRHYRRC